MTPRRVYKEKRVSRPVKLRQGHAVAPLENGDRLTSAEFMRRYLRMPDLKNAQLIEGIVYMPSPVSLDAHSAPHGLLCTWLGLYAASHQGISFLPNVTLILDPDNNVQPDATLCRLGQTGSPARRGEDGYLHGAPELVCEVSASTASIDLHAKMHAYRRNGIGEYLVWLVRQERIIWYVLEDEQYVDIPRRGGMIESRAFPGLVLNVDALLAGDAAAVLGTLTASRRPAKKRKA